MKLSLTILIFAFFVACKNKGSKDLDTKSDKKKPSTAFVNIYNQGILLLVNSPFNKDSILKSLTLLNKAEEFDDKNFDLILNKIHIYIYLDSVIKAKNYSHKILKSNNENNYIGLIYLGNINKVNKLKDSSNYYYSLAEKHIIQKISLSSYKLYLNNLIIVKCLYEDKLKAEKYLEALKSTGILDTNSYNDYLMLVKNFNEEDYLSNYKPLFRSY